MNCIVSEILTSLWKAVIHFGGHSYNNLQCKEPGSPALSLSGQFHLPSRSREPVLTLKLSAPLSRQQFLQLALLTAHSTGEGQQSHRQCVSKVIWR